MWKEFQTRHSINDSIINVIENEFKFDKITKVQNIVIPLFIKNKDVIVKSCTGSGKTLSYLIPIFQKLINFREENKDTDFSNKILSVIMLPSRELSIQVFNILLKFISEIKFTFGLFIGGKKIQIDLDKINIAIPNIIIATPGRLLDLEEKCNLSFRDMQILILDEADKMLELGFEKKITTLLSKFPKQRRTGLFSATVNSQIENLIKVGMRNPVFIDIKLQLSLKGSNDEIFIEQSDINQKKNTKYFEVIDMDKESFSDKSQIIGKFSQEIPQQLKQFYVTFSNFSFKIPVFIEFIKNNMEGNTTNFKIMVFFATCNSVDYYSLVLPKLLEQIENLKDFSFYKLHSKITQKKRKKEYKGFLNCDKGILLTTDLSSRGIDVPNLNLIIQFDPPKNEENYIHRVGRTARVGNEGTSVLFISETEDKFIKYMAQKNIKINEYKEKKETDENNYLNLMKEINKSDKWIYDKAAKAFVSIIRFYQEHDLKYIFDAKTLDIGNLANSFQLLRLPRMKEILGKKIEHFIQDEETNPKSLVYLNSNTAKQMEEKEVKLKKIQEEKQQYKESMSKKNEKKNRTKKEKKDAKIRVNLYFNTRILLGNGMILLEKKDFIRNLNKVKLAKKTMIKLL